MIPLFVDCSGRRIVIFGGGTVAARKAAYFSGKADVTVVSRSFVPAFDGLKITRQDLDLVTASGRNLAGVLTGAFLVIAAVSDPEDQQPDRQALQGNGHPLQQCRWRDRRCDPARRFTMAIITPLRSAPAATARRSPGTSASRSNKTFPALDDMIALQSRLREVLKVGNPTRRSALRSLQKSCTTRLSGRLLNQNGPMSGRMSARGTSMTELCRCTACHCRCQPPYGKRDHDRGIPVRGKRQNSSLRQRNGSPASFFSRPATAWR